MDWDVSCGELSAEDLHTKNTQPAPIHDYDSEEIDDTYGNRSQLGVIFNVMGTPRDHELSFLDARTQKMLRKFRTQPPQVSLLLLYLTGFGHDE